MMNKERQNIKEDWIEIELGKVGKVVSGGTPRTSIPEYWGEEVAWITPADLSGYNSKYISKGRKSISKLGLEKSSARLMPKNTVLFSSRAPVGYVVIAKNELATNQGFKSLIPSLIVNSEFIYYYLKSAKQIAEKNASGTTFKELSAKAFSNLPFPLAPLPEQRAIVAKIEQLFSELDNGIANLKAAKEKLEIYRQAVLKKAFEGELTKEWRKSLNHDAKDSYMDLDLNSSNQANQKNQDSDNGKLPKGWKWVKLGEVTKLNPKIEDKNSVKDDLEVQFVPMKLVDEVINNIHLTEIRKFSEVQKKSYTYFAEGDVIFAKVTPCMENGKIAIAKGLKNGIGYGSSEFHVFRCSSVILNHYLFYFLVQSVFRRDSQHAMTGAVGLRRVPKKFLEDYAIPLPSLPEQHAIVHEIETRLSVCDKLAETIEAEIERSRNLRQSILKKAFEGRLLSEAELEACRKEPDWEPASGLLKKIEKQKSDVTTVKRKIK